MTVKANHRTSSETGAESAEEAVPLQWKSVRCAALVKPLAIR